VDKVDEFGKGAVMGLFSIHLFTHSFRSIEPLLYDSLNRRVTFSDV
jgi:hypothetical protein